MKHDQIKWLTGTPPHDGRVLVEVSNETDSFLYPAVVKSGQFWFGKVNLARSQIVEFAYLDEEKSAPAQVEKTPLAGRPTEPSDPNLLPPHG
jgi:hypothetical protein